MNWLARFRGKAPVNPEQYERVRCPDCGGKGLRMEPPAPADHRERFHTCRSWRGTGYVLRPKQEPGRV